MSQEINSGKEEYIKVSNSGTIKDVINIRFHMWEMKANNEKKGQVNRCPMCQSEENRILQNVSWNVTKETKNSI